MSACWNSWAHKWLADFGNADSLGLARTYAERAMAQDSDNGWARFAMGHVMMDEGNVSEAIRHFRVGVEQLPGLSSQVDDLSTFLSYRGELVEGLYWGLEAYRVFPTNPNSRHHLALALGNRPRPRGGRLGRLRLLLFPLAQEHVDLGRRRDAYGGGRRLDGAGTALDGIALREPTH